MFFKNIISNYFGSKKNNNKNNKNNSGEFVDYEELD